MREVRGPATAHHTKIKTFIHRDLEDATHVFVRIDRPRGPLECPYKGPFKIIERISDCVYRIDYKGKQETINRDRLKPAFMEGVEDEAPPSRSEEQPGPSRQTTEQQSQKRPIKKVRSS